MLSSKELAAISKISVDKMTTNSKNWLHNILHGVVSGEFEKRAIETYLYRYAIEQYQSGAVNLTEMQLSHIYTRLREL